MYINENGDVKLGSAVRLKKDRGEWLGMIRKKFVGEHIGIVSCVSRWSGKIQVEFPLRMVNGLGPDDLEVIYP